MRRRWLWLAGLGLAAGPLAEPAWSQQGSWEAGSTGTVVRSARLGLPVGVPASDSVPIQPATAITGPVPGPSIATTPLSFSPSSSGSNTSMFTPATVSSGVIPLPAPGYDNPVMPPGTPIAAVIPSVQPPLVPHSTGGTTPTVISHPGGILLAPPSITPAVNGVPSAGGTSFAAFGIPGRPDPGSPAMLAMPAVLPVQAPATPTYGSAPNVTEIRQPPVGSSPNVGTPPTGQGYSLPTLGGLFSLSGPEPPLYAPVGLEALQRLTAPSKYYASAEFLLWWTKSADLPPLLTTSSPQFQGIPGLGDTRTLFGGNFGNTLHAGGRFTIGRWFGDDQIRAAEGRLFFLGRTDSTFAVTSAEYPVLARPFFNINTPVGPLAEIIATPGRGLGAAVIDLQNDVWGADVNYRRLLWRSCCARLDALVGYRYFGMKERLGISESFISTGGSPVLVNGIPVVSGTISDVFRAENHFHGGQIGLAWENRWGRWTFDARATIAFGNVTQQGEIDGGQALLLANGQTVRYAGGLLALPNANIGRYTHNQFAVLPEVGVNLGYQLTQHMRLFVGYNFLYLGNALRPERMIDTTIDVARIPNFPVAGGGTTPVPGLARPAPLFRTNDFFVQGINFGLEFRW
ncbi:MAG: BBP7 family outer membrane beta-barrel protein [Gemmataceae bacterium]|nr:BBP7 family outer membrane beta-barrel protein [Gemmataceae bacterium]